MKIFFGPYLRQLGVRAATSLALASVIQLTAIHHGSAADESLDDDFLLEEFGDFDDATSGSSASKSATGNSPAISDEINISDIRYVSRQSGGDVIIETSQPATYVTREIPSQNQSVIEISNARLPDRLKKPYINNDSRELVSSINAYQEAGSSTVRIVIQYNSSARPQVRQEGRSLIIAARGSVAEVADNRSNSRAPANVSDSDPRILPRSSIDPTQMDNMQFYGRPISIEVRDMPIRDVIALIAEQSGANIVLSQEVDGNLTLKLRQIPWDQALLTVMKAKNLGYVRQGSILRVAPYKMLQEESEAARRVVEAQKAAEPLRVKVIPVGYAKVQDLEKQILPFLTKERGKVVGDTRTNSLIVTDTVDVLERIASLVRALDLPPLQVLIEGKVIEAREQFIRDIGIKWGAQGSPVQMGQQQLTATTRTNMKIAESAGVFDLRIGQFDVFGDIQATLGLAETLDQVKVVSAPRIVTVNNEVASIVQSQNIPITNTTVSNGTPIVSTSYQPIEMRLEVTPQVTSENDVIMQISLKREFGANRTANTPPDVNRREAKTKVLVRNGQTAVIGGVYQSDQSENESGVPWLKDIPVLGWLFKKKSLNNDKTELLVFLTPRILNSESSMQKESTL